MRATRSKDPHQLLSFMMSAQLTPNLLPPDEWREKQEEIIDIVAEDFRKNSEIIEKGGIWNDYEAEKALRYNTAPSFP